MFLSADYSTISQFAHNSYSGWANIMFPSQAGSYSNRVHLDMARGQEVEDKVEGKVEKISYTGHAKSLDVHG